MGARRFVVARRATEPGRPRKSALDDPATREQAEATLGLGTCDDLAFDAQRDGGWGRFGAGLADLPAFFGQVIAGEWPSESVDRRRS